MIAAINMNASVDKLYLVDTWTPYAVNRVKECRSSAGGKGLNVARVARRCGREVSAGGFAGGSSGDFLRAELKKLGIKDCFTDSGEECRSCINIREQATGKHTEFLEPGPVIPPEAMERFWEDYGRILRENNVISISGSLPQGVSEDCYFKMITQARRSGRKVLLDASGRLLEEGLKASPYFIKPNREELAALLGYDIAAGQLPEIARLLCSRYGVHITAISLGAEGVVVACGQMVLHARPPEGLRVCNTVGCGDSMVAAFAAMVEDDAPLPTMVRYAVAVSAANALTWQTGDCRPEDVQMLFPKIRVEVLSE